MAKHDKENDHPEHDDLDNEGTRDEVSRIFKDHPHDYISKLEEIGFVYLDDDNNQEELEEAQAKPLNKKQEYLVSYFNGDEPLSEETVERFLKERNCPDPNYPLLRKHFKAANNHLLSLLLHGLKLNPVQDELLTDLAYFHEFQNILSILIGQYTIACDAEVNLEKFSELVMDFYYATTPDGYDALYALKDKYAVDSEKRKVIDFLIEIEDTGVEEDDEDIEF